MNSAMNIEFVYIILIGINNFMEGIGTQNPETEGNTDSLQQEILSSRGKSA